MADLLAECHCPSAAIFQPNRLGCQGILHQCKTLRALQDTSRWASMGPCTRMSHSASLRLSVNLEFSSGLGPFYMLRLSSWLRPSCRLGFSCRIGLCPLCRLLRRGRVPWRKGPSCGVRVQGLWSLLTCVAVYQHTVYIGGSQWGGKLIDASKGGVPTYKAAIFRSKGAEGGDGASQACTEACVGTARVGQGIRMAWVGLWELIAGQFPLLFLLQA